MRRVVKYFAVIILLLLPVGVQAQTQTLKDMTATTAPASTDILYVVINPGGSAANRKVTIDNLFLSRTGNKNLTAYASLSASVTAIGASTAVVEIPATTTVSSSLTIPSNITLMPTGAGMISVSASQTLTINGPFVAPLRQVFTGAGSVRFGSHVGVSYPQWFGAAFDNSTDDSAAIQKAIDAFPQTANPHAGGEVPITGGAIINSTLIIQKNSVRLVGTGWGISSEAPYTGFIKWNGAAGVPMILIQDAYNAGVENIRLIGKSSAKPTAAIEIKREPSSTTLQHHAFINRVFIGAYFGYDSDNAIQFDAGILLSGTVDGDTNLFKEVRINKCTIGVDIQNGNASMTHFDTLKITECVTGFKCNTHAIGTNWNFGANDLDLEVLAGRLLTVRMFSSEGGGQWATVASGGSLQMDAGGFEITNNIIGSGYVIDADQGTRVSLRNGYFSTGPGYTFSPLYKIRVKSAGGGAGYQFLNVENMQGIAENQIDVTGPASNAQRTIVRFVRPPGSTNDYGTNAVNFLTNTEAFDERRFDIAGAGNVLGGPFKVKPIVAPTGLALTKVGSGTGTTYSYKVSAITADGETLASSAVTISGNATLDAAHYIELTWNPVLGATGYKVYGRTGGSELLLGTRYAYDIHTTPAQGLLTSFKDDGSVTPSGALPSANTTAQTYLRRLVLTPDEGLFHQDISGNSNSTAVRFYGGVAITDGPSVVIYPDNGAFPGMFLDAGANSGTDIWFRKSLNGQMAMKIKQGTGAIEVDRTVTAAGTAGAQTINKVAGTVNIAAAGTTVTVTNSLVNTSSIILCVLRTNDATARIANVVPGSGSFVINLTAAATGEVSIGFLVLN